MNFKNLMIIALCTFVFSNTNAQEKDAELIAFTQSRFSSEDEISEAVENTIVTKKEKWKPLLDKNYQQNWDVFIGVPHATVKGLEGVDPESNGIKGKPLGLNNDPKKVFSFEEEGGETVLHISGEIYGALTSKKEYENYHLKLQFKWGDKKWEPRLERERDNGILYHCVGEHGAFWNVWMQSQEFQVQQGDIGDYYALAKTEIEIPSVKKEGEKQYDYKQGANKNRFSSIDRSVQGHCNKGFDNEKAHGEWNILELICFKGISLHVVNGKVVMALYNSKYLNPDNEVAPLTRGKIQIQSEAAEAFYKDIQIKSIGELPQKFKDQL